jgi:Retrotransposon gag protein
MNRDHPSISNPYLRVLTCVGRIQGKAVDQWVDGIIQPLMNGVAMWRQYPNHLLAIDPNSEQVWTDFDNAFRAQFQNTVAREEALGRLLTLQMQGEDLKTYINDFNTLIALAQWGPNEQGTLL